MFQNIDNEQLLNHNRKNNKNELAGAQEDEMRTSYGNKSSNRKYDIDDTFFEKIDSEEKAYTLGFIAADGSVCTKTRLIKIDQLTENDDILYKIKDAMKYENTIKKYDSKAYFKEGEIKHMSRLAITNTKMVDDIKKYGIIDNKTVTMDINLNLIPKELLRHFYRGLYEGDGSYSCSKRGKNNYHVTISLTSSEIMVDKTMELFRSIFDNLLIYKYYRKQNHNSSYIIISNKENSKDLLHWMYDGAKIYQNKKYNKAQEILSVLENREG